MCATLFALTFLIASAAWAQWRFRRFAKLPMHYDITMQPTWFASRWLAIWPIALVFAGLSILLLLATPRFNLEPGYRDPTWGLVWMNVLLVLGQGFILWLHSRWARRQG